MYTEHDTFKALKKIPFDEMRRLAGKAKISRMLGDDIDLDKLFDEHGWTQLSYEMELTELFKPIKLHDLGLRGTIIPEYFVETGNETNF